MYPAPVWAAFGAVRHAGTLPAADNVVCSQVGSPAARAQLELSARCTPEGVVEAARFRAYGCPTSIAVGEWLAGRIEGCSTAVAIPPTAADIRAALEIGEDKAHCALMGEDVLRALFDQIHRIRR
ncbi:iron-sulfur cluster assembly scaffold protein [Sinimarinibacterium sp. CAU 1509]|uniref:iron-sulfur cluster assembly scaffold protein n=1 Tax=Sinimarinibacterium sp. CAU 1509 TaxID=2562283 RepID=UPI002646C253|nr:iron-sulfur cluster assembly scaffold protein [Sinimarinibacterium sp. CAU 1509]